MDKIAKLKKKLKHALDDQNFYEAHQIYRTIYYRCVSAEIYQELLELLLDGAIKLIEVNEYTSAIDLSELYVETLIKSNTPVTTSIVENIYKLLSNLPSRLESDTKDTNNVDRRNKLLNLAVKWSCQVSEKRLHQVKGHPAMHFQIAKLLWSEKNWEAARRHFLMSDQPELKYFTELIDKYQPTIDRDLNYRGYLDKIGQHYFGLPAPQKESGGIIQNLMKGFMSKPGEGENQTADLFSSDDERIDVDVDDESYMTASSSANALNQEGSTNNLTKPASSAPVNKTMNMDMEDLD